MAGTEARCLGLIGGLGVGATVHYYRELVAAHERQGRVPRLLMAHADIKRVYEILGTTKDLDGLAHYLGGFAESLAAGGAEFTAIVAATPHICAPQLVEVSPIPLIDMLTEVAAALRAKGLRRVALLGTRFTVESRMFGSLGDIEIVMPPPAEIERINAIYMDVVAGRSMPAQIDELRKMAQAFITRDGAEAILIAGTDLSPVITPANAEFPSIDCAAIHIDAIMRRLTA
jgi:aspartate racemase